MEKSGVFKTSCIPWKDVCQKVKNAIVFMDYSCAECLFWNGGPVMLFEAGAIDIKDFSSFEQGAIHQRKAVFIVSTILQGKTISVLQDIITASKFDYCVVFTTVDIESHCVAFGVDIHSGNVIFEQCEEKVCGWMGNMNYTCEVLYAPLFMAPYTNFLFLVPGMNGLFPLLPQDLFALDSMRKAKGEKHPIQSLTDVHFYALPINYQVQIKQLVMYFNQLFGILNSKEEIFAVGHTSRLIATQLANLPSGRQRRKVAANAASLVLIDRSLDPVSILKHSESSLADKILGILPELPGHCNNVSVDMLKLTTAKKILNRNIDKDEIVSLNDVVACPGCLCPPDDSCPQLLQDIICLPQKDAVSLIKRSLFEAATEENISLPAENSDVNKIDEIFQVIESFYGNSGAIMYHNNMLQLSMAVAQALTDKFHEKWSRLAAVEKLLALDEDPISRIVELCNETNDDGSKPWSVEDIFGLLLFACSLKQVSDSSDDIWDELSSSLSLSISDCNPDELPVGLSEILGIHAHDSNDADLDVIQDAVETTVSKIKSSSSSRDHLTYLSSLLKYSLGPPKYKSLITQLMERILDPSKPDLQPDVTHVSTGLMDLLKSGFSMFKKVSQPRPSDAQAMFLFIVGGMSFEEAADVNGMVQEYNSKQQANLQVIIGSTRITSPTDAVDKFLFANNLFPTAHE